MNENSRFRQQVSYYYQQLWISSNNYLWNNTNLDIYQYINSQDKNLINWTLKRFNIKLTCSELKFIKLIISLESQTDVFSSKLNIVVSGCSPGRGVKKNDYKWRCDNAMQCKLKCKGWGGAPRKCLCKQF